MNKLTTAVALYLASSVALAAVNLDEGGNVPVADTVPMGYVVLFALLFFGMIIGFFVWMWRNEKHRKPDR